MRRIKHGVSLRFTLALMIGGICLSLGLLLLFAQESHTQNVADENRKNETEGELKERRKMFRKVSSNDDPADEGNRIVAIRGVRLSFEDFDKKGFSFKNQKELIEIEVFSKLNIPGVNARQYLIIGDKIFRNTPTSADGHTIFVHLSLQEFEDIQDGSIVSYVVSAGRLDERMLKESYKEGEPKQILGAKFGRLSKKMISQFPMINENMQTQMSRIIGTKNQPQ